MAPFKNPTKAISILLLFLLSSLLSGAFSAPAAASHHAQHGSKTRVPKLPAKYRLQYSKEPNRAGIWRVTRSRRMLIGSRAPICTFNECRECRFKCTAEQVPVDANDPMNSAYHYKCVCHR